MIAKIKDNRIINIIAKKNNFSVSSKTRNGLCIQNRKLPNNPIPKKKK